MTKLEEILLGWLEDREVHLTIQVVKDNPPGIFHHYITEVKELQEILSFIKNYNTVFGDFFITVFDDDVAIKFYGASKKRNMRRLINALNPQNVKAEAKS